MPGHMLENHTKRIALSTKRNADTWKVLRKEILFITVLQSHYY